MDKCKFLENGVCTYDINGDKAEITRLQAEVEQLRKSLNHMNKQNMGLLKDMSNMTALAEKYKCCGNCYHYDVIQDEGGVCCFDPDRVPADRDGKCKDWKFNEDQEAIQNQDKERGL